MVLRCRFFFAFRGKQCDENEYIFQLNPDWERGGGGKKTVLGCVFATNVHAVGRVSDYMTLRFAAETAKKGKRETKNSTSVIPYA